MVTRKASAIGYRTPNGGISDTALHKEIMAGVDDTPLRVMSAQRMVAEGVLTREEADMERNYISLLERGLNSASVKKIFSLAQALNVSVAEFMEMVEAKTKEKQPGKSHFKR